MIIFWRLVFAHMLADFTLQSNKINEMKRASSLGMALHVLTHPILYFAFTFGFWGSPWLKLGAVPIYGWLAIALITLAHYTEDIWRVWTIRRYGDSTDSALYFLWDQTFHLGTIFVFSALGANGNILFPERWPIFGILLVGATHFSVVLIYFLEKDFFGKDFPPIREKYLAIGERLAAFLTIVFLPGIVFAWTLAAAFLIVPRLFIQKSWDNIPKFSWALGAFLSLACGFLARCFS